ncbi:hypothetical protein JYU34_021870 [Plutella xylostella]|uniref:Uncharacterized protein n=2 Tax=Plutella xylostella TaxID=51655 RepID=A0ABQ7PRJ3_PLUXY|nr:hypothetical protein JYU34_021870 [Plutella xylostella]
MTNGPEGDFWHYHFSADEFYVLPVLLAYTLAYVIVMVAVIMCSVELKSRHLLHSTYKLFLFSAAAQHCGLTLQALQYVSAAVNGYQRGANNYMGTLYVCSVQHIVCSVGHPLPHMLRI